MDDLVGVDEGNAYNLYVLANDDPGNSAFNEATLEIVSAPSHAHSFRVHNDHLHYESIDEYIGSDELTYRICNTNGLCDTAVVSIVVTD